MSLSDAERANAYDEAIRVAMRGLQARIWTALPGEIVSFDAAKQTAVIQPTIQYEATAPNGSVTLLTMPVLLDCPVIFPRGGGCVLTFPLAAGDECLAVFASRCIDSTWQSGGVQPQAELRMHDLSDGFALVGFNSLPHAIAGLSTVAAELRSLSGDTKISLNPTAQTVAIVAPGGISLTGPVTVNGTLHTTGKVTTDGELDTLGPLKVNGVTVTVP